ncbi:MAG: type VI secretion system contractile sheath large subunit [Saccharospirillaceae bacterium]|nr:type VI secretion system contractile sheath large subunit [Pseudomonadales bacterium]NRB81682.1 type VI secretion system contractile sheath large subunit [Saccharospirillaceae bacterium]
MSVESQASSERINLVYRSSGPDGDKDVELPFRLLVLGDFSSANEDDVFIDKPTININLNNFSNVMQSLSVNVDILVEDKLTEIEDADKLTFSFKFESINDFNPENFVAQSEILSTLTNLRQQLLDILENKNSESSLELFVSNLNDGIAQQFLDSMVMNDEPLTTGLLDLCITELDERLGEQLDCILHHTKFQELESIWRSLYFLVERTKFSENCIIEILDVSKRSLIEDLEDAPEITQSELYNIVYTKEFGQFGGKPYTAMIGAYEFGPGAEDVWLLAQIASVSAMSHAPFLSAPSAELFDIDSFKDFARLRDLSANFEQPRFLKWNNFRNSEDARYVGLALPGFMLRAQYSDSNPIRIFKYTEKYRKKDKGLWGNAAFAFATRLLASFAYSRWCLDISGSEHGKVEGLNMVESQNMATREKKIPTEILISDRKISELVSWGFIPLSIHKGDDSAAFYGAGSVQALKEFANTDIGRLAELNHSLGSQLPYLFIVSRLSHYIKMMQREHIGSWNKGPDIEKELNSWIRNYVTDMDNPTESVRIRRPLRQAKVTVSDVDGKSDWYMISLTVTPHLKYMGSQFTLNETGKLDKN